MGMGINTKALIVQRLCCHSLGGQGIMAVRSAV